MKTILLAASLPILLVAQPAWAACTITGGSDQPVISIGYDPFDPTPEIAQGAVSFQNAGDESCAVHLYVLPEGGASALDGEGGQLVFGLQGASQTGGAGAGELGPLIVQVPAGSQASIDVRALVAEQQVVAPGLYSKRLTLRAETGSGDDIALAGDQILIEAQVAARARMSVSGTASAPISNADLAPAGIDFGSARTGDVQRVFVNVWANSSVTVQMSSASGGVLQHVQNPALPAIGYSARFDGQQISLAAPLQMQRSPPLSLSGASYELAVTLGDVSRKFAGLYRDIVTISVDAN